MNLAIRRSTCNLEKDLKPMYIVGIVAVNMTLPSFYIIKVYLNFILQL